METRATRAASARAKKSASSAEPDLRPRLWVENVTPFIRGGYPVKRILGQPVAVSCELVADGHDIVAGRLQVRAPGKKSWTDHPLISYGNDRFGATFVPNALGTWHFRVVAWPDAFATWRRGLLRKTEAGLDVSLELAEGLAMVTAARDAALDVDEDAAEVLGNVVDVLSRKRPKGAGVDDRVSTVSTETLEQLMARFAPQGLATFSSEHAVVVDPARAGFSAWYECFPRSLGAPGEHGTLRDLAAHLPYVARMGFDVLYLPPIHPIGRTHRKGPNNSTKAGPNDVGSPWAIGAEEGGHKSIHPALGTFDDFAHLVATAQEHDIQLALDVALQVSPDHPYVTQHPQWFVHRADGTIQYAENPPKKYEDIYPFHFECEDWLALWTELRSIFYFWIERGVTIFRVDNPHTKSLRFWAWAIEHIKADHPEVIFLAEAFTRPALMYQLAKIGFSQSYTYFTWRNHSREFVEYLNELTRTEVAEYFRPNFWPNTPDILPEHLQHGGRAAFIARLTLASTLSSNYGIYGPAFELMEHVPRPGVEEYIDNEKYQLRQWDLSAPHSLTPLITRINQIRREHAALQSNASLTFHGTDSEHLLCYSKRVGDDRVLMVVSLDHHHTVGGFVHLNMHALGLWHDESFEVHDMVTDAHYRWQGSHNYVELSPHHPVHIFRVKRWKRHEHGVDIFE